VPRFFVFFSADRGFAEPDEEQFNPFDQLRAGWLTANCFGAGKYYCGWLLWDPANNYKNF